MSDLSLHLRRLLRAVAEIRAVVTLQSGLGDGMSVDGGDYVRLVRAVAASGERKA